MNTKTKPDSAAPGGDVERTPVVVDATIANAAPQPVEAKPAFNRVGFGLACTVGWTELAIAMRKDGHTVNDSSGPNTRKWMEETVRAMFAPEQPAIDHQAIASLLRSHRLTRWQDDAGNQLPLVDHLTPPGSDSIRPGLDEIEQLADEIMCAIIDGTGAAKPAIDPKDAERLDWLLENVSSKEMRDLGIDKFGLCTRADLDDIIDGAKGEGGNDV